MSESIIPWISGYFTASGETHGADLAAIPLFPAKKKVQITEFLTYGRDDVVWARVSDKNHTVPIRFSRDAVEAYTKFSQRHMLQDTSAIISISRFRPFFARIPQGKGRMSDGSFLALECGSVVLVGGRGEPVFGRPEPLEAVPDLREWSDGLKEHGGAGNCLKNRKQAALEKPENSVNLEPKEPVEPLPEKAVIRATAIKQHNFQETWKISRKPLFRRPPDDVASVLASMKVDGESDAEQHKVQPPRISALPSSASSASSSQTRSATPFSEAEWPPSEAHRDASPSASPASVRHPTPAQRHPKERTSPAMPNSPPFSHPPASSHVTVVHETMLVPSSTESPRVLDEDDRKVPRPAQPFKSERLLAEPIILAPDSDLSHSQSQSQSQSQTQSQPVVLSQLSQLRRSPLVGRDFPTSEIDDDESRVDDALDSDDAQIRQRLSAPREVEHDARAWAAPSFQVARKSPVRRRVSLAPVDKRGGRGTDGDGGENLKEFIRAKLDGIGLAEGVGVVSWEMLYGILVGTARDREMEDGW